MIRRFLQKYKTAAFYRKGLANVKTVALSKDPHPTGNTLCDIICVTFNNPALLTMQHSLIKKHVKSNYNLLVADNSSDGNCRQEIEAYCKNNKIGYISLPRNPYTSGSCSHAAAMNWVIKNYISLKKPAYFGFIDHDIFPIEPFDITTILSDQPVYGLLQEREPYWYLWAGFCFFRSGAIPVGEMDFMPGPVNEVNLDTGGRNWQLIYSRLKKEKIQFPAHSYLRLREGEVFQSDKMERIGNWLHSFNGSYWMKVETKEHLLENYLQQYMS